jgi:predicted ArsR family transcriptional regulator
MLEPTTDRGLDDLTWLNDPVRRRLYMYVIEQPEAVNRDAAAAAVGISRALAAFHLDRLVDAGLLVTEYRRLGGRSGPGAGRPSKLYRPSGRSIRAALPERRFEVAANLFADALTAPNAGPEALNTVAEEYGRELGLEARRRAGGDADPDRLSESLESVLSDAGYVPFRHEGEIRLLNCPFHEVAQRHLELTCGMNLALLRGLLTGSESPELSARLDPEPGLCCVVIGASQRPPSGHEVGSLEVR